MKVKTFNDVVFEYCKKYKELNNTELARKILKETKIKKSVRQTRHLLSELRRENKELQSEKKEIDIQFKKEINFEKEIKKFIEKPKTIIEICNKFNKPPKEVEEILNKLRESKFNVVLSDNQYQLSSQLKEGGIQTIDLSKFENKTFKFGFCTDNHLNSKYERLDVLNAIYDIYEQEGITDVYNAGNWVDGEARFNKYELINTGITPQINYFVKNYPQRNGITTYYIAGDDHEGWWVQRERVNIGEYAQMMAEKAGRTDLKYLGYLESDVELKVGNGKKAIMKIMHPGGGTAYALSYAPQKIVESFTGGEKPQILLLGHYHKADFLPSYRNVHIFQGGCTQDQSVFMRKNKIAAHLGGWIIEVQISKDGLVNRIKSEWLSFVDKEYYKKQGYYR